MDGLVALRNEQALDPDAIESVEVGVSATGHKLIGEPQHLKTHPVSIVDGQFSMPFCAAVVLRHGNLLWDDYPVQLKDKETLALCRKVNTVVDERAEATFPDSMSGVVTVKTGQGSFETFVGLPKGEPGNFMSEDEFRAKFSGLCEPYLEENRLEQLADALLQLDGAANVTEVFSLSRPQAG
jgi:2-methylcitrate dehydratase PrpD